ncbi:hypothetical protein AUEXF2481DRAFT_253191 [Aureobasidium subglaciale EXF-2481]|uniref:Uncharacterized protein n=1 Tax=Aureobasidium subglaciale (strain EXF-2481) TaxID=1043005 RepID=A0A074YAB6_AURSE|nr:uncharacterized protein AUEXF2481DRAFT_253191 [Aureobasidium subglaciale EXF-2481]KEQ94695.1 hypothetical protein AUEXF2481DRAFT_253191 [Aureobasidium subglaciale EXF-2481]
MLRCAVSGRASRNLLFSYRSHHQCCESLIGKQRFQTRSLSFLPFAPSEEVAAKTAPADDSLDIPSGNAKTIDTASGSSEFPLEQQSAREIPLSSSTSLSTHGTALPRLNKNHEIGSTGIPGSDQQLIQRGSDEQRLNVEDEPPDFDEAPYAITLPDDTIVIFAPGHQVDENTFKALQQFWQEFQKLKLFAAKEGVALVVTSTTPRWIRLWIYDSISPPLAVQSMLADMKVYKCNIKLDSNPAGSSYNRFTHKDQTHLGWRKLNFRDKLLPALFNQTGLVDCSGSLRAIEPTVHPIGQAWQQIYFELPAEQRPEELLYLSLLDPHNSQALQITLAEKLVAHDKHFDVKKHAVTLSQEQEDVLVDSSDRLEAKSGLSEEAHNTNDEPTDLGSKLVPSISVTLFDGTLIILRSSLEHILQRISQWWTQFPDRSNGGSYNHPLFIFARSGQSTTHISIRVIGQQDWLTEPMMRYGLTYSITAEGCLLENHETRETLIPDKMSPQIKRNLIRNTLSQSHKALQNHIGTMDRAGVLQKSEHPTIHPLLSERAATGSFTNSNRYLRETTSGRKSNFDKTEHSQYTSKLRLP